VLKSIDVLIGLTVVLLALSMAVTVITQSITTIVNSRGRHLRRGLTDLLQQLDPALTATLSGEVATKLLTHPLVSGSNTPISAGGNVVTGLWAQATRWVRKIAGGPRLGNVVHREEFSKLLMALAATDGTQTLEGTAKSALKQALANNGIADPDATLKNIRTVALQLERANPALSNAARQNAAILQEASSDLVAKINNWFDQTMDRTSQRFTASTRAITFVAGFIVAFGLQIDTPLLVNRLAADDKLRDAFVTEAKALYAQQAQEAKQAAESAKGGAQQDGQPATVDAEKMGRQYSSFLATNGVITLPTQAGWKAGFRNASLPGLLVTALLLSLGAPFWYDALGQLLQLRSVLAVKDDVQRTARQSTETPPPATPGAA
jgi:hypothetical protein